MVVRPVSTHPGMLIAYDAAGDVVGTLDYLVQYDDDADRTPLGLVDFAAHEEIGGELTSVWNVSHAAGSKSWPEYLGSRAHDFRVELVGPPGQKRIGALIHKVSGHRRERAAIEAAIAARVAAAQGDPADIRDLVGGPSRPLPIDEATGQAKERVPQTRPALPLVRPTPPR
jgi:hypothetical protein